MEITRVKAGLLGATVDDFIELLNFPRWLNQPWLRHLLAQWLPRSPPLELRLHQGPPI